LKTQQPTNEFKADREERHSGLPEKLTRFKDESPSSRFLGEELRYISLGVHGPRLACRLTRAELRTTPVSGITRRARWGWEWGIWRHGPGWMRTFLAIIVNPVI
jgi:hypothetical protein